MPKQPIRVELSSTKNQNLNLINLNSEKSSQITCL